MDGNPFQTLADELPDTEVAGPGYGQRELLAIGQLFRPDMPDGDLINLYFLVQDWHTGLDSAIYAEAFGRIEDLLLARMSGGVPEPVDARDWPGFEPEAHADAMEAVCAGQLSDWQLLEMYNLSSSERSNEDDEETGRRWQAVMDLSRCQILRRIKLARSRVLPEQGKGLETETVAPTDVASAEPKPDFELISLRNALKVAEEAFHPDMSPEKLVDLFVLVKSCGGPDVEVFNEIEDAVTASLMARMEAGEPDPEPGRQVPGFDPDEERKALKAVIKGRLPHANLLMLYRIALVYGRGDRAGKWLAIADLCRAQIIRRVAPPPLYAYGAPDRLERERSRLTLRVLAHDHPAGAFGSLKPGAGGAA
ncbi:hypothetical protein [Asticcacaulis sp. YBE204]|uniref:hypothetical protein n=1 Tax=Asticcacaulis sp. YBE204 TaxID=1282363 RepID=UPI0003C3D35B|nr:hypothetical protein [Asticcacaulis sp. YBE204]ESQ76559.1 hypothetical protein AEYBE204_19400 [Asticcacaulis sp. YBE204]